MSPEDQKLFFLVMREAYRKGLSNEDISVLGLVDEIKQMLLPVLKKSSQQQKEV
ncbi:hypothetical protein [Pseudoneobacillus sp. C159]